MKKKYVLTGYEADDGWRWRLTVVRNGKLVAEGGEAYATLSSLKRAFKKLPFDRSQVDE
jgi:hypothetical protein